MRINISDVNSHRFSVYPKQFIVGFGEQGVFVWLPVP